MTIFGEVMNPGGGRDNNSQEVHVAKLLKTAGIAIVLLIAVLIFFNYIASVTRIGAGYVGVEIVLSGSQRGPSEIPIRTGWVFYSPLRSQIIEFPTFVQTVKWTQDLMRTGFERADELQLEGGDGDLLGRVAELCDRAEQGA